MKLHYELKRSNDTHLSDCIGVYKNVVPKEMCVDLIKFYEENREFSNRTDEPHKLMGSDKLSEPRPIDAVQYESLQLIGDPREESKHWVDFLLIQVNPEYL